MSKTLLEKGFEILEAQWDGSDGGYPPEITTVGDYVVSSGKSDYDSIQYWHKSVIKVLAVIEDHMWLHDDFDSFRKEITSDILAEMDGKE